MKPKRDLKESRSSRMSHVMTISMITLSVSQSLTGHWVVFALAPTHSFHEVLCVVMFVPRCWVFFLFLDAKPCGKNHCSFGKEGGLSGLNVGSGDQENRGFGGYYPSPSATTKKTNCSCNTQTRNTTKTPSDFGKVIMEVLLSYFPYIPKQARACEH